MTSGAKPLHETLWNQNRDLATACLNHAFVRGLADGTLDGEIFKRYVAQDAFFLRAFARAYELAAERSSEAATIQTFRELGDAASEELRLHARYAETLGIDLEQVSPYPATRDYTDFLLQTAMHAGVDEIVAAMTPCMRLYAYLGKELAAETGGGSLASHPYREWIETYSGTEFQAAAAKLETLLDRAGLDRLGLERQGRDRPAVREVYRYALECELRFFSAPIEDIG